MNPTSASLTTTFMKLFGGVPYNRRVQSFDVETCYDHVCYDAGYEEDLTEEEL